MVARTARRVVPAPEPTGPTPFADAALDLYEAGLAVIPLGGDDGKVPLVARWDRWEHRPGRQFLEQLADKHPTANVGIVTGLSGITVVDVDDPDLVDDMVHRFGVSPLITATPSGGEHHWFRSLGERNKQRLDGLKVDIRGVGGMVVVPPSVRPTGPHAGKLYTFLKGGWDDLRRLPTLKPGSLYDGHGHAVYEGTRGNTLFKFLLRRTRACDTFEDLLDVARTFNDTACIPPLSDGMVVKAARSVWTNYRGEKNWAGGPPRAVFLSDDVKRLVSDPDGFALLAMLKVTHSARPDPFALAATAMRRENVMPGWGRNKYMAVTKRLTAAGDLDRVYEGGKYPGDGPSLYKL